MPQLDLPTINSKMARIDAISKQISTISDNAHSQDRFVTSEEKELCDELALEHSRIKKELGIKSKGKFGSKYPKTAAAKYCPKCKQTKPLDDFYEYKGKLGHCRPCRLELGRILQNKNRESRNESARKYWAIPENRERRKISTRKSYLKNKQKKLKYLKEWKKRYRKTPRGNLDYRISAAIRRGLKNNSKNGQSWKELLPYSLDQLQRHLRKTMPTGYSWKDFLSGDLHIDHITPLAFFSYSSPNDLAFMKAWSLKNLQLLPAEVNIKKSDTLEFPTQHLFPF